MNDPRTGDALPLTRREVRDKGLDKFLRRRTQDLFPSKKGDPDLELKEGETMGRLPKALITAGLDVTWKIVGTNDDKLASIMYDDGERIWDDGLRKIRAALTQCKLSLRPLSDDLRAELAASNPIVPKKAKKKVVAKVARPKAERASKAATQKPVSLEELLPNREAPDRSTPVLRASLAAAGYNTSSDLAKATDAELRAVTIGKNRKMSLASIKRIDAALAQINVVRERGERVPLVWQPSGKTAAPTTSLPPEAGAELPAPCGGLCHLPSTEEIEERHRAAVRNSMNSHTALRNAEDAVARLRAELNVAEASLESARTAHEANEAIEVRLAWLRDNYDVIEGSIEAFNASPLTP